MTENRAEMRRQVAKVKWKEKFSRLMEMSPGSRPIQGNFPARDTIMPARTITKPRVMSDLPRPDIRSRPCRPRCITILLAIDTATILLAVHGQLLGKLYPLLPPGAVILIVKRYAVPLSEFVTELADLFMSLIPAIEERR